MHSMNAMNNSGQQNAGEQSTTNMECEPSTSSGSNGALMSDKNMVQAITGEHEKLYLESVINQRFKCFTYMFLSKSIANILGWKIYKQSIFCVMRRQAGKIPPHPPPSYGGLPINKKVKYGFISKRGRNAWICVETMFWNAPNGEFNTSKSRSVLCGAIPVILTTLTKYVKWLPHQSCHLFGYATGI